MLAIKAILSYYRLAFIFDTNTLKKKKKKTNFFLESTASAYNENILPDHFLQK